MKPWTTLATAKAPGGSTMTLVRRDDWFVIRVDNQELMANRMVSSEVALAKLTCEGLGPKARILIGGLGMGFTVRAALDLLPPMARIDVAEFVPEIVEWNRGVLAPLAKRPLEDRRVHVLVADVTRVIAESPGAYDAILLDVDNGPISLSAPGNANLYGEASLLRSKAALKPGGVFAVWAAGDSRPFVKRLEKMGFDVKTKHVRAHQDQGPRHVVFLARPIERPARPAPRRTR